MRWEWPAGSQGSRRILTGGRAPGAPCVKAELPPGWDTPAGTGREGTSPLPSQGHPQPCTPTRERPSHPCFVQVQDPGTAGPRELPRWGECPASCKYFIDFFPPSRWCNSEKLFLNDAFQKQRAAQPITGIFQVSTDLLPSPAS